MLCGVRLLFSSAQLIAAGPVPKREYSLAPQGAARPRHKLRIGALLLVLRR